MTLAEAPLNAVCVIEDILDSDTSLKLMEMGCFPGEEVVVKFYAPFKDPIAIEVFGVLISLRKEDAVKVIVHLLETTNIAIG